MGLRKQLPKAATTAAVILGLANGATPVILAHSWGWGLVFWPATTAVLCAVAWFIERRVAPRPRVEPRPEPVPEQLAPPPPLRVAERPGDPNGVVAVFVHGLFSSPNTWEHFHRLAVADPDLDALGLRYFGYRTPPVNLSPTRRIPDLDTIGKRLCTYFSDDLADYRNIVLVTHSMGGLAAQLFVEEMLNSERGKELARLKHLIMFACPNTGSELLWTLRKFALRAHPQGRDLRSLSARVNKAHEVIINKVIHATGTSSHECHIPIWAYAGDEDAVVDLVSAHSVLPRGQTGVLPGDHFTIIRPDSPTHSAYITLKRKLKAVLDDNTTSRAS